jgi:hypothetical protein
MPKIKKKKKDNDEIEDKILVSGVIDDDSILEEGSIDLTMIEDTFDEFGEYNDVDNF